MMRCVPRENCYVRFGSRLPSLTALFDSHLEEGTTRYCVEELVVPTTACTSTHSWDHAQTLGAAAFA